MRRVIVALAALAVTVPLMCTQPAARAAPAPTVTVPTICVDPQIPNRLIVARHNQFPMNSPTPYSPNLHRVVRARAVVHKLYSAVCALRSVELTSPPSTCPADSGIRYTLTFRHNSSLIVQATANATGCQWLFVGRVLAPLQPYGLTSRFWKALGLALHISPRLLHAPS